MLFYNHPYININMNCFYLNYNVVTITSRVPSKQMVSISLQITKLSPLLTNSPFKEPSPSITVRSENG